MDCFTGLNLSLFSSEIMEKVAKGGAAAAVTKTAPVTLKNVVKYLGNLDGRDKFLKLVQYLSRLAFFSC